MQRAVFVFLLFFLNASGILLAQRAAADPAQRYFRLICLVHLTGSGQAGDPTVPEYVVQGTAVAQAAIAAAAATAATTSQVDPGAAKMPAAALATATSPVAAGPAPMAS